MGDSGEDEDAGAGMERTDVPDDTLLLTIFSSFDGL